MTVVVHEMQRVPRMNNDTSTSGVTRVDGKETGLYGSFQRLIIQIDLQCIYIVGLQIYTSKQFAEILTSQKIIFRKLSAKNRRHYFRSSYVAVRTGLGFCYTSRQGRI